MILNKLITDKNISTAEYRILCYLLMRAGNQDICYPSLEMIANDTGVSLSTVKRKRPSLANKGYLKKINHKKANGSATSNLYILLTNYHFGDIILNVKLGVIE